MKMTTPYEWQPPRIPRPTSTFPTPYVDGRPWPETEPVPDDWFAPEHRAPDGRVLNAATGTWEDLWRAFMLWWKEEGKYGN